MKLCRHVLWGRGASLAVFLVVCAALSGAGVAHAGVCRVTTTGTVSGDGSNWTSEAMDLATALATPSCTEVWVARGIYRPATNDPELSFSIRPGVAVYGGFAQTEDTRSQRDPAGNPTVLSGDIDINDCGGAGCPDGIDTGVGDIAPTNSYHVVVMDGTTTAGGIDASTVFDGFTITGGMAFGREEFQGGGGGILCNGAGEDHSCSPTLSNLVFRGNGALFGGAIYNEGWKSGAASPIVTNVTFDSNSSDMMGGAMYNRSGASGVSNPVLTNVTFHANDAFHLGGAMYNDGPCDPVLTNVTFNANHARLEGGAMYNAGGTGLGIPKLTNVIMWGDTAPSGPEISNHWAAPVIVDSVIQGGCFTPTCTNIITDDPLLGPLQNNGGSTLTMLPGVGSSAIDAGGTNSACAPTDQRGVPRPQGPACDIGAVEVAVPVTLTVRVSGEGVVDAVDPSPLSGGISNCDSNGGSTCSARYPEHTHVTLVLTPNYLWQVGTVTGCGGNASEMSYITGPITGPCTVTVAFIRSAQPIPTLDRGMPTLFAVVLMLLGLTLLREKIGSL